MCIMKLGIGLYIYFRERKKCFREEDSVSDERSIEICASYINLFIW